MKNFIMSVLPVLLVSTVISYNEPIYLYIWFLPIPIIIIFQMIYISKVEFKYEENSDITLGDIIKSKIIDLLLLAVFMGVLYLIFEFIPNLRSLNTFYLPLYFIFNKNIFNRTIGCKIAKIKFRNESFIDKVKILINNFLTISPIYVIFLRNNIQIEESNVKVLVEFLLFINLINMFVRFFILRKKSFFEAILSLDYLSVK